MSKIRSMSLTTRIMIGMALGVAVGFIFQAILAGEDDYLIPLGLFSLPIKAFLLMVFSMLVAKYLLPA